MYTVEAMKLTTDIRSIALALCDSVATCSSFQRASRDISTVNGSDINTTKELHLENMAVPLEFCLYGLSSGVII